MPRTTEQNQEIREATRAKLLDSSMILFAENGYTHTSIRKIAAHANVSVGLLYHYFDNKEELLTAVFDHCIERINQSFMIVLDTSAPLEKINLLVQVIFSTLSSDPIFWGLFYSLRAQPPVTIILGDSFRLWTSRLRNVFIELYREAGHIDPETDAYVLYSLIEGTIQQYLLDIENYPLQAVAERIAMQIVE